MDFFLSKFLVRHSALNRKFFSVETSHKFHLTVRRDDMYLNNIWINFRLRKVFCKTVINQSWAIGPLGFHSKLISVAPRLINLSTVPTHSYNV